MRHSKEEPTSSGEQMIDFISAVEELSAIASKDIIKLLKDSDNFSLQCNNGKGSLRQVDMERLASSLPLHLIAVILSPDRDARLTHMLHGVRLLHTMADLASRHARFEQVLLEDVKVSEQLMDLVFLMLIVLAQTMQVAHLGTSLPILHSTLLACTLHLLTCYISSQWPDLVHVLLAHPKVDIFMDVAFDAVHADIRLLYIKLLSLNNDVLCNKSSLSAAEITTSYLCQQCEASLQFLLSLCQQKLFRDRLLKNKELCKNGGVLSLSHTILKLNVPDCVKESSDIAAAISRLKAKVLSILLQLCEAESISYLDEVAGTSKSMHLAKSVALEILHLLKAAVRKDAKQLDNCVDKSNPRGLVLLNSLRLADIFSDDSNFRSFFMNNAIQVLAEILAIPHNEFQSSWCSIDVPMAEEDANIEYDPFIAAGAAFIFLSGSYESALPGPVPLNEIDFGCLTNSVCMPSVTYAQQKTSYLVKIIANLHCFVPNICEEEERNLFLNKFCDFLSMETPETFSHHANSKAQKSASICQNLSSLSSRAESLIPNLLNDEDVQLLRGFNEQLKKLIPPQNIDDLIQETGNKNNTKQALSNPQQDAQNGGVPPTVGQLDASTQIEVSCIKDNDTDMKGEIPGSSLRPELNQINIASSKPADLPDNFGFDQNRRSNITIATRSQTESLRGIEKEIQNFDTKDAGIDFLFGSGELYKTTDVARESGFQEDEKADYVHGEERQPRKRKRNIMNERQVILIEKALVEEPEMQKNSALLQRWADTLSAQGSEITPSQLKNWLNNRKARLARAAREARAPSEGENGYLDKNCGPSTSQYYDSPDSAGEEPYVPPPSRLSVGPGLQSIPKSGRALGGENQEMAPQVDFMEITPQRSSSQVHRPNLEPGRAVVVVDSEGKEVGRGKVFQMEGRWHGRSLEGTGTCIVDVTELKAERWKDVPHPIEGGGRTFEEVAARNGGVVRVVWDVIKTYTLPIFTPQRAAS